MDQNDFTPERIRQLINVRILWYLWCKEYKRIEKGKKPKYAFTRTTCVTLRNNSSKNCNFIHMFGFTNAIDLFSLSKDIPIIKCTKQVVPELSAYLCGEKCFFDESSQAYRDCKSSLISEKSNTNRAYMKIIRKYTEDSLAWKKNLDLPNAMQYMLSGEYRQQNLIRIDDSYAQLQEYDVSLLNEYFQKLEVHYHLVHLALEHKKHSS